MIKAMQEFTLLFSLLVTVQVFILTIQLIPWMKFYMSILK